MTKLKYRPDIDGLRAIAVLAVLFYHAGAEMFSGGYIGVDVFFVISGYLITAKIIKEIQTKSFTLSTFYELRIRRIFPALFSVVIFTLIAGGWLFNSSNYSDLSESAVATTFSLANLLFWTQSGYFDKPSILKPLLHTWSLSIEEQFYLFLPLILILISRFIKSKFILVLSFIAGISLIFSVYVLYQDASAAFFFAHLRAWEFLVGSLLSLIIIKLKPWHQNIFSFLGLTMILFASVAYSDKALFPGQLAVVPVLGAAFIIYGGIQGKPFVSKILSTKPLVFIGKISYSLYLWHWPFIVFGRYYLIRETKVYETVLWLFVTFIVSVFSWKFIETPFRIRSFLKRPKIFVFAGSYLFISLVFGFAVYLSQGFPSRFASSQEAMSPFPEWDSEADYWIKCFAREENNYKFPKTDDTCLLGDSDRPQSFLLWGDSHAHAIASGVNASAIRAGVSGKIIGGSGCPPLLDINFSVNTPTEYCYQQNHDIVNYIEQHPEFKTIILSSRWALYTNGERYKIEEGSVPTLTDLRSGPNESSSNAYLFELGLNRMVDKLMSLKREVVIVSSIPEIGYDVPSSYFIASRTDRDINNIIAPTIKEYFIRNATAISTFANMEKKSSNIVILEPSLILCDSEKCKVIENHIPLYRDDDHLSTFGAKHVSTLFDPVFHQTFLE